jgi:hypothetical protein
MKKNSDPLYALILLVFHGFLISIFEKHFRCISAIAIYQFLATKNLSPTKMNLIRVLAK